jgi:hypothetical protein
MTPGDPGGQAGQEILDSAQGSVLEVVVAATRRSARRLMRRAHNDVVFVRVCTAPAFRANQSISSTELTDGDVGKGTVTIDHKKKASDDEILRVSFRNRRGISGHVPNPSAGSPR